MMRSQVSSVDPSRTIESPSLPLPGVAAKLPPLTHYLRHVIHGNEIGWVFTQMGGFEGINPDEPDAPMISTTHIAPWNRKEWAKYKPTFAEVTEEAETFWVKQGFFMTGMIAPVLIAALLFINYYFALGSNYLFLILIPPAVGLINQVAVTTFKTNKPYLMMSALRAELDMSDGDMVDLERVKELSVTAMSLHTTVLTNASILAATIADHGPLSYALIVASCAFTIIVECWCGYSKIVHRARTLSRMGVYWLLLRRKYDLSKMEAEIIKDIPVILKFYNRIRNIVWFINGPIDEESMHLGDDGCKVNQQLDMELGLGEQASTVRVGRAQVAPAKLGK
jgi:hypothetical protein